MWKNGIKQVLLCVHYCQITHWMKLEPQCSVFIIIWHPGCSGNPSLCFSGGEIWAIFPSKLTHILQRKQWRTVCTLCYGDRVLVAILLVNKLEMTPEKVLNVMEDVMFCTPFKMNIRRLSRENHPEEKSPSSRPHLTTYIFDYGVHPLGEYTSFIFVIPSPWILWGNTLTFTFHFKHFTWSCCCCCCWFFRN